MDRRLLHLAVPTLGALLAQPLFALIDTAMVGHLGKTQLAGLGVGSTIITTAVGVLVFLAYATTAAVARALGAGQRARGVQMGIEGMWFAACIGVVSTLAIFLAGPVLVQWLGASGDVHQQAVAYLRAAAPGITGMLVVMAATGTLRGLSRVREVLAITIAGATLNVFLNAVFMYGLRWGVAGSGAGTALAELSMAVAMAWLVGREARRLRVSLQPTLRGLGRVSGDGWPLFVRTISLRLALLVTLWAATRLGVAALSAHQVVMATWNLLANALDATAIAAQTLIGESLGAGRESHARRLLRRCVTWGIGIGAGLGVIVGASSPWLPALFSPDDAVRHATTHGLVVAALGLPLAGVVFVLDGVLIGAGDGQYLAYTGVINLVTYLPAVLLVGWLAPTGATGLVWLWVSYCAVYMTSRAATLGWRARGNRWVQLGA